MGSHSEPAPRRSRGSAVSRAPGRRGWSSSAATSGGSAALHIPAVRSLQTGPARAGPVRAGDQASRLFCQHLLEHGLVQAEVSHELFQLHVLLLRLPELPQLRRAQTTGLLLPAKKRGLLHAHLTAHLGHQRTKFRLLQGECNLFIRLAGLPHRQVSPPVNKPARKLSQLFGQFPGLGSLRLRLRLRLRRLRRQQRLHHRPQRNKRKRPAHATESAPN